MRDKVYFDIESSNKEQVADRAPVTFPTFMYDSMIMQYGLFSVSIKVLMQLANGLKTVNSSTPFGYMLAQVCGLAKPRLRSDEI